MELISLKSPTLTTIPSSLSRSSLLGKPLINGQVLKFQNSKKFPDATKLKFLCFKAQALGTVKAGSDAVATIPSEAKKDEVVFVAGATGKVGSRTVRELLKLGFQVRAGVRSAQRAATLVQSVKEMKLDINIASGRTQAVEKLEIVECDLEKPDRIRPAIGKASVVICCIGASEKEVFDVSGPYRIDYQATKNLIDAASVAKVNHFIMVSSLGTNKIGFPAAILNLFWGVLIWKRKAEEALIASGLPYSIVRPGGMERPTDAYKETHNITLSQEDTLFGGQVSNLQVAELMAFMAKNRTLSYCKVLEVVAETTAPLTPLDELLAKIPSQRVPPKEPEPSKRVVSGDPSEPVEKELPAFPTPSPSIIVDSVKANDSALSTTVIAEAPSTSVKVEPAPSKAILPSPLSPYAAYDDLKPPTSPSPAPPNYRKDAKDGPDPEPSRGPVLGDTSESVEKELPPIPSPSIIVDAAKASDSAPSTRVIAQAPSTSTEEEPVPSKAILPRPLSPYAAYNDLKPPTSPSPAPPSHRKDAKDGPDHEPSEGVVLGDSSASVDKEPPTSPIPSPSINVDAAKASDSAPSTSKAMLGRPLSPYAVYDDLKPPTSPSPIPKTTSVLSASSVDGGLKIDSVSTNGTAQLPSANKPREREQHTEPTLKPLSPYAMYDDLKPPTTPMPSPRK